MKIQKTELSQFFRDINGIYMFNRLCIPYTQNAKVNKIFKLNTHYNI